MRCNLDEDYLDLSPAFPIERLEKYILKSQREEILNCTKTILVEKIKSNKKLLFKSWKR